ncbi:MAG: hypothetical protein IJ026_07845 [Candidatus Methanomethylophilaceae archaeon]|nr:hypothetical protein [Candidatus Methanomethylophilaceae archaeon]
MSYLDTCCIMLFMNRWDRLRNSLGVKTNRNAESLVRRNHGRFIASVPALGEAIQMTHAKCDSDTETDAHTELIRMMDNGFIEPRHIISGREAFRLAGRIASGSVNDDRDTVSPMDALITAVAATDPECVTLYTTDDTLNNNYHVHDTVCEWREAMGYDRPLRIVHLVDVLN